MLILLQTAIAATTTNLTIFDCYYVASLATSLQLNRTQPAMMNQVQTNCCAPGAGVICKNGRVSSIIWSTLELYGKFAYSFLPTTLVTLDVSNNKITDFPSDTPDSLETINLSNNSISSTLPYYFPKNLTTLKVYKNSMYGSVLSIPKYVKNVYLGYPGLSGNSFYGTIRLAKPVNLFINNNDISGISIDDTSALVGCDISYNPLAETNATSLTMCTQEGLHKPSISDDPPLPPFLIAGTILIVLLFFCLPCIGCLAVGGIIICCLRSGIKSSSFERRRVAGMARTAKMNTDRSLNATIIGVEPVVSQNFDRGQEYPVQQFEVADIEILRMAEQNYGAQDFSGGIDNSGNNGNQN